MTSSRSPLLLLLLSLLLCGSVTSFSFSNAFSAPLLAPPALGRCSRAAKCARPSPARSGRPSSPLFSSSPSSAPSPPQHDVYRVLPISRMSGTVTLPGSKSLSNRCLLLAALSSGDTTVSNLLASDDISYMLAALKDLGVKLKKVSESEYVVSGVGGPIPIPPAQPGVPPTQPLNLFLGNAGTAMRPLAAALAFSEQQGSSGAAHSPPTSRGVVLDGVQRMRERPIADLVDGLRQLGANVECSDTGCPPVVIKRPSEDVLGKGIGGTAVISGKMSSQFLSALLMAGALSERGVQIKIKDELISAPYVALTIGLMNKFGVTTQVSGEMAGGTPTFTLPKRRAGQTAYKSPGRILVEGDASSASYFLAGAAITGGNVTVVGCGSDSVQGDVRFASVLSAMGASVLWRDDSITVWREAGTKLKGGDFDCGDIPDAAMTLAAVALFAEGPTTIRNVGSWRLKETERMKAIVAECTKLGATVEEFDDYCVIHPPPGNKVKDNVEIETYDDHRMAMTFALAACGGVNVYIKDPKCTAKTFPDYFEVLESVVTHC